MAANDRPGGRGPGAHTHLRQASQDTWDALRTEEGMQQHAVDGQQVHITRRGSFMLQHANEDGTHDISILHSPRTANLIAQREAFAAQVDAAAAASRRAPRGEERANSYSPPEFPRAVTGHLAQVTQYAGTAQEGFRSLGTSTHGSGKAGGNFSDRRMSALHTAGWPRGSADDTHHSEADYTASQLARPASPPRGGVLVHQMTGVNDMCATCRTGASQALAPVGSASFVSYTGQQPFGTQGQWEQHPGPSAVGPGQIVRGRPETMMQDHQADHLNRAGLMVELRNPPRVGSKRKAPEPSFHPPGPGGGPDRKPPPPPPPPPSAGAAAATSSSSSGGLAWSRTGGRLVRT